MEVEVLMSPETISFLILALILGFGFASYRKHKRIIAEKKRIRAEKEKRMKKI